MSDLHWNLRKNLKDFRADGRIEMKWETLKGLECESWEHVHTLHRMIEGGE